MSKASTNIEKEHTRPCVLCYINFEKIKDKSRHIKMLNNTLGKIRWGKWDDTGKPFVSPQELAFRGINDGYVYLATADIGTYKDKSLDEIGKVFLDVLDKTFSILVPIKKLNPTSLFEYKKNDKVIVKYDDAYYMGKVLKINDSQNIKVKCFNGNTVIRDKSDIQGKIRKDVDVQINAIPHKKLDKYVEEE